MSLLHPDPAVQESAPATFRTFASDAIGLDAPARRATPQVGILNEAQSEQAYDQVMCFRGIAWGVCLSVPMWLLILAGAYAMLH